MKNIKEHIKLNQFSSVYLIYGTENYLKKLYKDKLKDAILSGTDDMNYNHYEGKGVDINQVIEISNTLPFFHDRRLILIENSGLFKNANDLADYIKEIPGSSHIVFVENEVDKRNRLYKAVKDKGTISEMNSMDEKNLKLWIASLLKQDGKRIAEDTIHHLISKSGSDMENLQNEIEKLVCYAYDRDIITKEDVEQVCTTQIIGKVFLMIDAIGNRNQDKALEYYYDLLALREKPMTILYLIARHFNILIQIKELAGLGYNNTVIAQKTNQMPFAISKYITQSKNFSTTILKEALDTCTEIDEHVKTGRMIDKIGVEILIVRYSSKE